jgi:hypothetical protein
LDDEGHIVVSSIIIDAPDGDDAVRQATTIGRLF